MKKFLLIIALIISGMGLNAQNLGDATTIDYEGYSLQFTVTNIEPAECSVRCSTQPTEPTAITIPEKVEINGVEFNVTSIVAYAFYECSSLTSIEIPSGVTEIGVCAFKGCSSLTSIEIPNGVKKLLSSEEEWGDGVFTSCTSLKTVTFGENSQLTYIGANTFASCTNLESIEIPSGVTEIGSYAFSINVNWGEYSHLKSVTFGENSQLITIGVGAFSNCSLLTSIEIPSSVTEIKSSAFEQCLDLKSVTFGENSQLKTIDYRAFGDCSILQDIEIPDGVTTIAECAFENCNKIKNIEIPSSVEELAFTAFIGCYSLSSIVVDSDNNVFDSRDNCNAIIKTETNELIIACANTMIPNTVTKIGQDAFKGLRITSINIPDNVIEIDEAAFYNCTNLRTIAFGDDSRLTTIGSYAFYNCTSLKEIDIPNGVTKIGSAAFYCTALESIEIPSGVTVLEDGYYEATWEGYIIHEGVFFNCTNLKTVTFGENSQLSYIGSSCFALCENLISIDIPSGVTEIGDCAFIGCNNLKNVNFEDDTQLKKIGEAAFRRDYELILDVPSGVNRVSKYAFDNIKYLVLNSETIPDLNEDISTEDAVLTIYVPEIMLDDYNSTYPWNRHNILPIDPAVVTVSVNDTEAGTVVGAGNYCKGMEVGVIATPEQGYTFVGWKENGEIVSTDAWYYFTLYGDRNLVAEFELSKYWHADLNLYPNTMTITAEVMLNSEYQNSTMLEVGAFCGDELRGSGRIEYVPAMDKYLVFLSVTGETYDPIRFKLYDHETETEFNYISLSVLSFEVNAMVGSAIEPYLIEFSTTARIDVTVNPEDAGMVIGAGDYPIGTYVVLSADANYPYTFESWTINGEVVSTLTNYGFVATESLNIVANFSSSQRTTLQAGWNWFSTYTYLYGSAGLVALENGLGEYGLHIKNQNSFVTNHDGVWYGSLLAATTDQMYMIRVSEQHNIVLNGMIVEPQYYNISLTKNWKWLPYIVSREMSIEEAFSNITPNDRDMVKTQGTFSTYYEGIGWIGDLETMTPGKGYMYYNNSETTLNLVYPMPSSKDDMPKTAQTEKYWTADVAKYSSNMNMIAVLDVEDEMMNGDYEIAAFAGDELRGSARPIYVESLNRYMLFLTISGEDNANITFKYYDVEAEEEIPLMNNLTFSVNAIVGSVDKPYILTNIGSQENGSYSLSVYPNPVDATQEINFGVTCDRVEVYNSLGAKVAEYDNVSRLSGIDVAGVYVIKATVGSEVKYDRLIVK